MARGSFASLSPGYRARLERSGITREAYEAGASLKAARGHAATPERPSEAERRPDRYREYLQIRQDVRDLKRQIYGDSPNFKDRVPKGNRRHLEKGKDALEKRAQFESWDAFVEVYPEYDTEEYDWIKHYH